MLQRLRTSGITGPPVIPTALETRRAAGPAAQRGHVVVGRVGGLGRVGQHAEVRRRGQAALVGVEHIGPDHDLAGQRRDPDLGLAVEPEVRGLPAVELELVLGGDVVDGDEDLVERVLDDRRQGAVPAVLLAAERQPPALEPARRAQRRVWAALAHAGRIEVRPVGGVQRHGPQISPCLGR